MERTVGERSMGLRSSPFAPGNQQLYDAGAGFWQPQRPPFFSPSRMRVGMFPFTAAQWQELQRQALIYKHIVASVPVPADLILPSAAASFPEPPAIFLPPPPPSSQALFGVNGRTGEMEEGRCRRTDGKKWRCAREAAPEQKYCERHLNRGRPRSRKHVDHRRSTTASRCKAPTQVAACPPQPVNAAAVAKHDLMPDIGLNLPFHSMESSHEPRREEWMKSYQENQASCGQWEAMRQYEELPNLNYTDTNESWCPFLNANLPYVHDAIGAGDGSAPPRRFIDAWSRENSTAPIANKYLDGSSASGRNKLPLPALTLSMSCADEDGADNGTKSQPLNWLAPELAEALHSSTKTSPRNSGGACSNQNSTDLISLMCNYGHPGSHEASPRDSPTRLVSSPSGVLHKALVSLSDSSSSSSPTFAAASRSDITFQWMNMHK